MSGAHETQPAMSLVGVERGGRLERVVGEDHLHLGGLHAAGDQHVQEEVVRRRVLRQHDLLAAQVGHRLDRLADHDAVAAVRPVDLLKDARHGARCRGGRLSTKPSMNSGTMSSVAQPMCRSPAA